MLYFIFKLVLILTRVSLSPARFCINFLILQMTSLFFRLDRITPKCLETISLNHKLYFYVFWLSSYKNSSIRPSNPDILDTLIDATELTIIFCSLSINSSFRSGLS